jgi:hypothetical protein
MGVLYAEVGPAQSQNIHGIGDPSGLFDCSGPGKIDGGAELGPRAEDNFADFSDFPKVDAFAPKGVFRVEKRSDENRNIFLSRTNPNNAEQKMIDHGTGRPKD